MAPEISSTQTRVFNLATVENDLMDLGSVARGLKSFIENTMDNLKYGVNTPSKELTPATPIREKGRTRFEEIVFRIDDVRKILNDTDKMIQELSDLTKF
jgi:ABC-type transport system involved in Fe-S cluster assembly fused permease/ATPase subunit